MLDLQASPLADIELLEQLDFDPEVPCQVVEVERPRWCVTTADHRAEFVVVTNCGHSHYYCEGATAIWNHPAICSCMQMAEAVSILPMF